MKPQLTVVIGANGAGKTTWTRSNRDQLPEPFYNADSIAEGLGDANSPASQERARELVDQEIEDRMRLKEDFGFESTWSGKSRPEIVCDASAQGYTTRAVFLGTNHPGINISRVRQRVREGGHNVPESEIVRRWTAAYENLLANWGYSTRSTCSTAPPTTCAPSQESGTGNPGPSPTCQRGRAQSGLSPQTPWDHRATATPHARHGRTTDPGKPPRTPASATPQDATELPRVIVSGVSVPPSRR